jgi:hypothetical protein
MDTVKKRVTNTTIAVSRPLKNHSVLSLKRSTGRDSPRRQVTKRMSTKPTQYGVGFFSGPGVLGHGVDV